MKTALSLFWLSCLKQKKSKSFNRAFGDRKRSDGFKLEERRVRGFFVLRVVRPCLGLPKKYVDALSLEGFKARLDKV